MTKLKMIKPEVIPGFDVLKWKEETQLQIYEEIKDMSTEEVLTYFRQAGERFDKDMEERRKELAKKQENVSG